MLLIHRAILPSKIVVISCVVLGILVHITSAATIVPGDGNAVSGTDFNLTCHTKSPTTDIVWQKGAILIKHYYSSCTVTDIRGNISQRYRYLCPSNTTFVLIIPGIYVSNEKGSSWECNGNSRSKPYTINVYTEPKKDVQISGYNETGIVANQNSTLTCSVEGGFPLANLSWSCNGSNVKGNNESTSQKSISILNFPVYPNNSGLFCVCTALHPLWQKNETKKTKPLIVLYSASDKPVISGYETSQPVSENTTLNLTCSVPGGVPLTTLTWYCNGFKHPGRDESTTGVAKSVLLITVNRTLHQEQCFCIGTSAAGYNDSAYVTFDVYFPAIFMDSPVKYSSDFGTTLVVQIQFYSSPEITSLGNLTWIQDTPKKLLLDRNSELEFKLNETKINVTSINTSVINDCQSAMMVINSLDQSFLGTYRLVVQNRLDLNATFHFEIAQKTAETSGITQQDTSNIAIVVVPIICLILIIAVLSCFALKRRKKSKFRRKGRFRVRNQSSDVNNPDIDDAAGRYAQDGYDNTILIESGNAQVRDAINMQNGQEYSYVEVGEKNRLIFHDFEKENITEMENLRTKNSLNPDPEYAQVQKIHKTSFTNGMNGNLTELSNKQNNQTGNGNEYSNQNDVPVEKSDTSSIYDNIKNENTEKYQDVQSNDQPPPLVDTESDDTEQLTPKTTGGDGNEGLTYTELQFVPKTETFKIIGKYNGVEYAEVVATSPARSNENSCDPTENIKSEWNDEHAGNAPRNIECDGNNKHAGNAQRNIESSGNNEHAGNAPRNIESDGNNEHAGNAPRNIECDGNNKHAGNALRNIESDQNNKHAGNLQRNIESHGNPRRYNENARILSKNIESDGNPARNIESSGHPPTNIESRWNPHRNCETERDPQDLRKMDTFFEITVNT